MEGVAEFVRYFLFYLFSTHRLAGSITTLKKRQESDPIFGRTAEEQGDKGEPSPRSNRERPPHAASSPRQSSHADGGPGHLGGADGAFAFPPPLPFERLPRRHPRWPATMMAAAALRPHKSSPARVPTRCVAALCAACFLVGVGVVNRSVRLPSPLPSPSP